MQIADLPTEAQKPGQRITLLLKDGTLIHATFTGRGRNMAGERATRYLLYKRKHARLESAMSIEYIKAVKVGWKTLEEMTCK